MVLPDALRRFSLLAELDPIFVSELSSLAQNKTAESGEWLFHEGDTADALYLISRGSAELKLKLDEKRNMYATVSVLRAGDAVGLSALVEPYVYNLGASASSDTQLLRFDGNSLRELLEKYPEQGYILMRGIAQAMKSRVSMLGDQAPRLTWRFVTSSTLFASGVLLGILVLLLGISILIGLIGGHAGAAQAIPIAVSCLILPAALLFLARVVYPVSLRGG